MSIGMIWRGRRALSPLAVDAALAVVLTVLAALEASAESGRAYMPAALLLTVPLAWRRRWPLLVFGLIVVGAIMAIGPVQYAGFTAIIVAAYSVGVYCHYRPQSLCILLATATAVLLVFGGQLPRLPDAAGPYVVLVPPWLIGNAIRTWQLRAGASEDRAMRLEREQEQATRAAVAAEHARIARELHDVVAHSVSVMVIQAGAARHVLVTSPQEATEALLAVEASGREAMTELRRLLGVLNQDDASMALAPQPGVEQLESLVQHVSDAGLPVALHIAGQPQPLSPGVNLTAYRVVQEALTNALKYAGMARTVVILDYRESALKIEILDEGPTGSRQAGAGVGRGLVGMRERVALYGGTLEAGPRLERGYAVRVWLPLEGNRP